MTTTMNDRTIIKESAVIAFAVVWCVSVVVWLFS